MASGVEQVRSQARGEETTHGVDANAHPSVEVVERSGGPSVSVDAVHGLVDEGFLRPISAKRSCEDMNTRERCQNK